MLDRRIAKIGPLLIVIALRVLWDGDAHATVFTVDVSDDHNVGCDGVHCSLRKAIVTANASTGSDQVSFAIPGLVGGGSASEPQASVPNYSQLEPDRRLVEGDGLAQTG